MLPMGTSGTPSAPSGGSPMMNFPSAGMATGSTGVGNSGMMPHAGMAMMGMPGMATSPTGMAGMPGMTGMQTGVNPMQAMMMMQAQMMQQQMQLLQRQGLPSPPPPAPGSAAASSSAASAPTAAMTPSQFDQQAKAYEATLEKAVVEEVKEIQHHFKLDDRIAKDLDVALKKRSDSFDDDVKALWEILEGARNPAGLLRVKLREMDDGSFRGGGQPAKDVEEMAKKFNLDAQAAVKLAEVLGRREDRKKDVRQLTKHLELSNKPSSLVMLMLKDLRAGNPIKDPEYPAAVGSYAHKRGLKRRSRSRDRSDRRRRRDSDSDDSSSPPTDAQILRSTGAGPKPGSGNGEPRPMTLLERFG
mmetsp:Transcript_48601/g.103931  ORF Transcript_48601/g.103931 Transcript_48601/m.103931 type:complete len:358 (+) Transcript_48601:197-1270(+)